MRICAGGLVGLWWALMGYALVGWAGGLVGSCVYALVGSVKSCWLLVFP